MCIAGLLGFWSARADAQEVVAPPFVEARTAPEALQILLEAGIQPSGPLRGDGALIAGLLAAQGLTFPISSSSGAFATRQLGSFSSEPIDVSSSGSFGPLFAERGRTNGRGNLSLSLSAQRIVWGTLDDSQLAGHDLVSRRVYRNDQINGPAGTVDEFGADIRYTTDAVVLAANYGLTEYLDVGAALPMVRSQVDGMKRLLRTRPQENPAVVRSQRVVGTSSGLGDVIVRLKANVIPVPFFAGAADARRRTARSSSTHVAVGFDWRVPTGATAELFFDCRTVPCSGTDAEEVPDVGLGVSTAKLSAMGSVEIGRFSPHLNVGHTWVHIDECGRGGPERCTGVYFEIDPLNNTQDAKDQRLSNEWTAVVGADYQLLPYRATVSFDVIGRQIVRAGQFYKNRSRLIYRRDEGPESSIVSEVESRHGNANPLVAAAGAKVSIATRWILVGHVLLPLNRRGLQPRVSWVIGMEHAIGR